MHKISKLAVGAAVTLTLGMAPAMAGGSLKDDHHDNCSAKRWAGLYGGINVGGVKHTSSWLDQDGKGVDFGVPNDGTFQDSGITAGVQVGYNVARCNTVFGLEADYNFTNSKKTTEMSSQIYGPGTSPIVESGLSSFGTIRGRAGVAFDHSLLYLTGGLAIGKTRDSWNWAPLVGTSDFNWSSNGTRLGWTVGAGIEHALSDRMSLKAEVLYIDLGSKTVSDNYANNVANGNIPSNFRGIVDDTAVVGRVGLNFKFGQ